MTCPPGKIVNPSTGRCVKRDGAIGRRVLGSPKRRSPVKKSRKLEGGELNEPDTWSPCERKTVCNYVQSKAQELKEREDEDDVPRRRQWDTVKHNTKNSCERMTIEEITKKTGSDSYLQNARKLKGEMDVFTKEYHEDPPEDNCRR